MIIYGYLKNRNIIYFKIPAYPELEPKNMWPLINQNEDLMEYFPDLKPSQLPEKEFLYGIICTLRPDEVRQLIVNGVKNRSPKTLGIMATSLKWPLTWKTPSWTCFPWKISNDSLLPYRSNSHQRQINLSIEEVLRPKLWKKKAPQIWSRLIWFRQLHPWKRSAASRWTRWRR